MNYCILPWCFKRADINRDKLFYHFPPGEEGMEWARNLFLPESVLILYPLVCEDHFEEENFHPVTGSLYRGSVPTVLIRPPDWDFRRPIIMHLRKVQFLRKEYMKYVKGLPRPRIRRGGKRAKDCRLDTSELMLPPSHSKFVAPLTPGLVSLGIEFTEHMALEHGNLVVRKLVDATVKRERRIGLLLLTAYNNTLRGKLGLVNSPVEKMLRDVHKRI